MKTRSELRDIIVKVLYQVYILNNTKVKYNVDTLIKEQLEKEKLQYDKMINEIKNYGLKVGIAINPETDEKVLYPYLSKIDQVLVMSVHPGKSGQSFIENTPNKIENLKK